MSIKLIALCPYHVHYLMQGMKLVAVQGLHLKWLTADNKGSEVKLLK